MTLDEIMECAVTPALELLPPNMGDDRAKVMLLAIGLQESRFTHRRQMGGPARGHYQFEQGGGVYGVLRHKASGAMARAICRERGVEPVDSKVYAALEHDDVLAAALARLLLWTDPQRLPDVGDVGGAWELYLRVWRPGKPHRKTWNALYAQAMDAVLEAA